MEIQQNSNGAEEGNLDPVGVVWSTNRPISRFWEAPLSPRVVKASITTPNQKPNTHTQKKRKYEETDSNKPNKKTKTQVKEKPGHEFEWKVRTRQIIFSNIRKNTKLSYLKEEGIKNRPDLKKCFKEEWSQMSKINHGVERGRERWTMEVDYQLANYLINAKRFLLKKTTILVHSIRRIEICLRCSEIGHHKRTCKKEPQCTRCAGKHERKYCIRNKRTKWSCPNCLKEGIKPRHHEAVSEECPVLTKARIENAQNRQKKTTKQREEEEERDLNGETKDGEEENIRHPQQPEEMQILT